MSHYLSIAFVLFSFAVARTPPPATRHAVRPSDANGTWTNEDVERLSRVPGLISVVGQPTNQVSQGVEVPAPPSITKDPAWYAEQAVSLNARIEADQADFRDFTQALDDVRELKSTTGGVNLAEDDIGITPQATIEILQNRVREAQRELDALEDLARRNGIPSGALRGPWQIQAPENAAAAAEQSQYAPGGDL